MTRGERVRAAARTLTTPRSAGWVAEQTDVSSHTAQKYLDQLVEDDVLATRTMDERTLYYANPVMAYFRELRELQEDHSPNELSAALEDMHTQIEEWQTIYEADSPNDLRASIGETGESMDRDDRRAIASRWEHLNQRIDLVSDALEFYSRLAERDALPA
jgi:formylglycine-generating enzyme required for sulfatase activity